jgi:type IV fimbrial biogenesis protein FimT
MSNTQPSRSTQRGVTLIEAMCVLVITSIAIGSALPGLGSLRQRVSLSGVAAQLETDLQLARSQAVAMNRTVHFSLREAQGATCYMVHTGPATECSCGAPGQPAVCSGGSELLRSVSLAERDDVQVRSSVKSLTLDPVKGTVTPTATLRVESRDGRAIHQVVNIVGRVRSCSPQGRVAGERAC